MRILSNNCIGAFLYRDYGILESCFDYKEALKVKESFTYKLGGALIKVDSGREKFGFLQFLNQARKLRREFKKRENNGRSETS